MAYSTTELLADVRRSGMFPANANVGTADADLLAHGDKEMQARLLPLVLGVREEFYIATKDYAITGGQGSYRIPPRSIGGRLRDVFMVQSGGTPRNLARIEPERMLELRVTQPGVPWAFYVEGNNIVLVPTPASTNGDTLRLKFFARPNRLVLASAARQISTITANTPSAGITRITCASNVPSSFTTSVTYDIVRATPNFEHVGTDMAASTVSAANVHIAASLLPSDFTTVNYVNDWLCLAEESPIPQLPAELGQLLAQRVLCRVLDSIGDIEALAPAERQAIDMEHAGAKLIQPRVEGEPRRVLGQILFRGRRFWGGRW